MTAPARFPDGPAAVYLIDPMGAPRMTQRDRWKKRPVVERYHAFRDAVRHNRVRIPEAGAHITFVIPMPDSWSKARRKANIWQPHQQRPDVDNLAKALLDAVYAEDCRVHDLRVSKIWGDYGMIVVSEGAYG